MAMKKLLFTLTTFIFFTQTATAQNEVLREQNSLRGIQEFGVVINVESGGEAVKSSKLAPRTIRDAAIERLAGLPISILSDNTLRQSDQLPILHLHINILNAGQGLYPYTAELKFYQPVKLSLNRDLGTMASTWSHSFVGIVSHEYVDTIQPDALNLFDKFAADFKEVNL